MTLLSASNTVSRGWTSLSYRLYIERQNLQKERYNNIAEDEQESTMFVLLSVPN